MLFCLFQLDAQGGAVAKTKYSTMKIRASLLATALACMPFAANAAGLGKITVLSGLGQPLRAEVEVSATKAELEKMTARLASREAFQDAGLEYTTSLSGLHFALDKKNDGRAVIRITSDHTINDPFMDMLVEVNWSSGRLTREYTFLLDPPEVGAKAATQVATVEARSPARVTRTEAPVAMSAPAKVQVHTRNKPRVAEEGSGAAPAPAPAPAPETSAAASHKVKRGETLHQIAAQTQPEGVSLEQMLVGLYQANKGAFEGGNMNRLKAGRILSVPEKGALTQVSPAEAKKIVLAQSSNWNAYRRKLAAAATQAPARDENTSQSAGGKVSAKVDDKAAPANQNKDQVRLSKTDSHGAGATGAKPGVEDKVAANKALTDANERIAALEKNVSELKKLLEMKNQNLADLQKQASAKPQAPTPAPVPAKPAEPAPAPKPQADAAVKPSTAVPETSTEAAKPEASVPPEAAKPATPPKPVTPPKPKAPPPPPPEEPSLVDDLLDNPLVLGGAGAVVLGLGAIAVLRRRRAKSDGESVSLAPDSAADSSLSQPSLGANSVFKSTGGQSVDTSNTPATDFSQAGPGTIDTDEVDPVAEADVYMAYGRDAQAEEILLEAMQKDPKRFAIHLKLLEIYANRKAVKQFETLASELYAQSGGAGAEWEKAAAMGLKLDPSNPLYGGKAPETPALAVPPVADDFQAPTPEAPALEADLADTAIRPADAGTPAPAADEAPVSLDFDLGLDSLNEPAPAEAEVASPAASGPITQAPVDLDNGLDFNLDLGAPEAPAAEPAAEPEADLPNALDFQLPPPVEAVPEASAVPDMPVAAPVGEEAAPAAPSPLLDFDLDTPVAPAADDGLPPLEEKIDLTLPEGPEGEEDAPLGDETLVAGPNAPAFDLSGIDLDLDKNPEDTLVLPELGADLTEAPAPAPEAEAPAPALEAAAPETPGPEVGAEEEGEGEGDDPHYQEVATKLDLAKAYEEMGDKEGARELLQEVLSEGNEEQQQKAQELMTLVSA